MCTEVPLTPACTEGTSAASAQQSTCIHIFLKFFSPYIFSARYLYTDLYSSLMWTGTEAPEGSGNYTSAVKPVSCSKASPIGCESVAGSTDPLLGYVFSFGEDSRKDVFVLASKGVYRVVRPSLCGYTCPAERPATDNGTAPGPGGPSSGAPAATRLGRSVAAVAVAVALALIPCVLLL